jgi:hypothetical protein
MSALPPKADFGRYLTDVCFVPKADIGCHFQIRNVGLQDVLLQGLETRKISVWNPANVPGA